MQTLDKLFGGLNMSWLAVVIFAVATAIVTAVFLQVPVFQGTSFEQMGITLEAWVLFGVIIMSNCKKPLESALKTFVFFLISQPLIYLLQVPFSHMGWEIFKFYKYWFIWTLLTFPMAFAGWFIRKKNWLSVLILAPANVLLVWSAYGYGKQCVKEFPHMLVACVFCLLQIALYIVVFGGDMKQRLVSLAVPLVTVCVLFFVSSEEVSVIITETLPDSPSFSDDALLNVDDATVANIQLHSNQEGIVYIQSYKEGTTEFTVTDKGKEYKYRATVQEDGNINVEVLP